MVVKQSIYESCARALGARRARLRGRGCSRARPALAEVGEAVLVADADEGLRVHLSSSASSIEDAAASASGSDEPRGGRTHRLIARATKSRSRRARERDDPTASRRGCGVGCASDGRTPQCSCLINPRPGDESRRRPVQCCSLAQLAPEPPDVKDADSQRSVWVRRALVGASRRGPDVIGFHTAPEMAGAGPTMVFSHRPITAFAFLESPACEAFIGRRLRQVSRPPDRPTTT